MSLFGHLFQRALSFPHVSVSICFPYPGIPSSIGNKVSQIFHKFFCYMNGSLRIRKIMPSCPAEHSRQGYSGSHYSNKVCDINRADVKSLLTLYQILWEYMLLGNSHESNHIPSQSHHQPVFLILSEHHLHLSQIFVSSFPPEKTVFIIQCKALPSFFFSKLNQY